MFQKPPSFEMPPLNVTRVWALHLAFERALAAAILPLGLTVAEFRLVGEVMRVPGGLRQGDLAQRLGVRAPTVSAAVTRLERNGVLSRRPDPDDPRARIVVLAEDAPLTHGVDILKAVDDGLFGHLSPADREALGTLLEAALRPLTESPSART